jgi:hypothetical protein
MRAKPRTMKPPIEQLTQYKTSTIAKIKDKNTNTG